VRWAFPAAFVLAAATVTAQAPPDVETLLAKVGERIADYYKRAQNVVCTEKTMVQPVGYDYAPRGFARLTEYELRVEADADGETSEAKVVRQLLRVNGKAPREKDKKDRAGCTDANPLSTEPLAFLLPAHRSEYTFVSGGFGKGKEIFGHQRSVSRSKPKRIRSPKSRLDRNSLRQRRGSSISRREICQAA